MNIDVAFIPDELQRKSLTDTVAILIDVVRATTTIATALAHGSAFVLPVLHVEDAFRTRQAYEHPETILLGGERGGKRVEGFDLGNSPREYQPNVIHSKGIIFSTTNGTRTLLQLHDANQVLVGAFVNMSALCEHLIHQANNTEAPLQIQVACSGVRGTFSLEDTVCAGMIVKTLARMGGSLNTTPAAIAAEIIYEHYQDDLLQMLHLSDGGRRIVNIGLKADLEACAEVDKYTVIPIYRQGTIRV